ncbi:MAG: DUF1080 domain-containing protein [Fimbriimonadia bacterium]|jgi:type 1 glutamine amidotransferase
MFALIGTLAILGTVASSGGPTAKIKVLFLSGWTIHEHETLPPVLLRALNATGDFEVTLSSDKSLLAKLSPYDVVLLYTTGGDLTKEEETGLWNFVDNGKGLAGIHSASDSFKNSDKFWQLLGGRFVSHGAGTYKVNIKRGGPVPEIVAGLGDFTITDETYVNDIHKKSFIQPLAYRAEDNEPAAWIQQQGKGRVFYTNLGHGMPAWTNESFQKLVVNGLYWVAGRTPSPGALDKVEWGFRDLFNGKDLSNWIVPGDQWQAKDGVIDCKGGSGGWLMSKEEFEDFEFRFEYRISKGGNSGASFRATLEGNPAFTGHEIQILDDHGQPPSKHGTASLYDAIAPTMNPSKPAWEWNEVFIRCVGRQLTVTQNGLRVMNVNLDDAAVNHPLEESVKMWNRAKKGHFAFQDHGYPVQFRNVRVRVLP